MSKNLVSTEKLILEMLIGLCHHVYKVMEREHA